MLTVIAILIDVLLPLYAVFLAWSSRNNGRLFWILRAVAALAVMGFLTLVARWDLLSTYLVYLWWAAVVVAILLGLVAMRGRRWVETETPRSLVWAALDPVIGVALFVYAGTGLLHGTAIDVAPPLGDGRFAVVQGGNNPLINYHNSYAPQRFALDIVQLDEFGRRADGIQPTDLDGYVIYGTPVLAPCSGTVAEAVDDIADTPIGDTNTEQPAGNHVVLTCANADVELAHFRPGSVSVAAGDAVDVGQQLGEVGNSGNTTEPHLHIHAVPTGTGEDADGIPLTFDGAFPVRNSTFGS